MITAALLLLLLFIAGVFNLSSYFPSKKLYARLHSLFLAAATTTEESEVKSAPIKEERKSNPEADQDEMAASVAFATFDKNGDGFITKQELKESLKNIRISVTEKEAEEMVVKVDANGDGLIDFEEFKILYRNMTGGARSGDPAVEEDGGDVLKEAFEVFDRDSDGLITVEELGSVLSSLGMKEGKRMEDCKEMIRRVDVDGDGMVNFDEFKTMMTNGGGGKLLLPVLC
ncbi:Calmodulin-like protein 3 [Linum grandiflorum]